MKHFFDDNLFLTTETSKKIYKKIKDLPIIDYHCHLNPADIAKDIHFSDIGELWLSTDHYKWRAMRLCGVDEDYITGSRSFKEKFIKYAEILPKLVGNPLYYWTHMELKQIFGIDTPLTKGTAELIYDEANKRLSQFSVQNLLKNFKVCYVATTDDAVDDLRYHGIYDGLMVAPTFRPDKLFTWDKKYLSALGSPESLQELQKVLSKRLDYFVSKGCKIADHGFGAFPKEYVSEEKASEIYLKRDFLTIQEKDMLFGYLLKWLSCEYKKRGILMQLHFSVSRNVNAWTYKKIGADSGFDVPSSPVQAEDVIKFLNELSDVERPTIVLYSLNESVLPMLAAISGAYRNVYMGPAWWFNDTVEGIRKNLSVMAEYAVLGTNFGMLTDSRSFSSYVRFDFFRRILCAYIGALVEKGEYDFDSAEVLAYDICYGNIARMLGLQK